MPAKKKQKEKEVIETPEMEEDIQEPEGAEEERFQQMETRLTKKFESQFMEFQKAIENIAKKANESNQPKTKKSTTLPAKNPHDTRNKALRQRYNPEMEVDTENFLRPAADSPQQQQAVTANAMLNKYPDQVPRHDDLAHAQEPFTNVNIRPARRADSTDNNRPVHMEQTPANPAWQGLINTDKNKDMNQWLINKALTLQPATATHAMPMSIRDMQDDDDLDMRVQNILANTASTIARGNARPGLFPYKYVFRGDDLKRATMNSLSISDHCWAIFRMIRDETVPQDIKPYLYTHIEQVLEGHIRAYNWQTAVRPWSNEVFSRVAEGRFSNGWASHGEIQLLRISISQTSTAKLPTSDMGPQTTRQATQNFSNDQFRGGPPCVNFNSQKGCNLHSGHVVNGQKLLHICAYCLFNSAAARPHSEYYCRNKQRQASANHF